MAANTDHCNDVQETNDGGSSASQTDDDSLFLHEALEEIIAVSDRGQALLVSAIVDVRESIEQLISGAPACTLQSFFKGSHCQGQALFRRVEILTVLISSGRIV